MGERRASEGDSKSKTRVADAATSTDHCDQELCDLRAAREEAREQAERTEARLRELLRQAEILSSWVASAFSPFTTLSEQTAVERLQHPIRAESEPELLF